MAAERQCRECGSSDLVEDAHYSQEQLVCADCGCIVTEGVLTTTQHEENLMQAVSFSKSSGENEAISRAKLKGILRVRNLCKVLGLPGNFADTAVSYYERIFHHSMCHSVRADKKEAIMGCCVYITIRQHGWPVTMATISSMLYSKQELFHSMFPKLVEALKIDIPSLSLQDLLKSHCSNFRLFQNSASCPPEYAEKLDKVLERALQIVELAVTTWLVTGRHPIPIITAAAYLSWQSLRPVQRLSCKVVRFCKLCETDFPPPTSQRIKEFIEILVKLAQQLPWLKVLSLNKKTVIQNLGDILKHRTYLLRKALAAEDLSFTEAGNVKTSEEPSHASSSTSSSASFLPPCMMKPKKRSYQSAFEEDQKYVTGDEEISDSEIDLYIKTPAEVKVLQQAQDMIAHQII